MFAFVALNLVFKYLAKRLARKNIPEMTSFVLGGMWNLNSVNQVCKNEFQMIVCFHSVHLLSMFRTIFLFHFINVSDLYRTPGFAYAMKQHTE